MAIDPATGAFTWTPTEAQGGTNYSATVTVTDNGTNPATQTDAETIQITVAEVNVAPVLAEIPPQRVNFGETLAFTASASDQDRPVQTLGFSLEAIDGQNFPTGATIPTTNVGDGTATGAFSWTPTAAQAQSNYTFTVAVSDGSLTNRQTVTIGAVTATQYCPGFRSPSVNMVVTNSFTFTPSATLTNLVWTPVLPNTNWVVTATAGTGNGTPTVQSGSIVFTTLPTSSPVRFTYTVTVPGNAAVSNNVRAVASFRYLGWVAPLAVDVAPMAIYRYHSADYQRDVSGTNAGKFRTIDSTEMNRVLGYWRAGAHGYTYDVRGFDGYVAWPLVGASVADRRHSADYQAPFGVIDNSEMGRVQVYWRTGGYSYSASPTSPDGYMPGSSGVGPSKLSTRARVPLGLPVVEVSGLGTYNPGQTAIVTCRFAPKATLLSIFFTPQLPSGWTIQSVSGNGGPSLNNGTINFTAPVLPTDMVELTVTVRVPLAETRPIQVGNSVMYWQEGMEDFATLLAAPLAMMPLDINANGMADSWEQVYASGTGVLNPTADPDGDRLNNLAEYLCGTIPTDSSSVLRVCTLDKSVNGQARIEWSSEPNRVYILQRADGTPAPANFTHEVATDVEADPSGTNVHVDVDTVDPAIPHFYRVKLQQP